MASENRPGVIVTQALAETAAVTASPSLVPLVMAPCFQIIEAVNSDGSVNSTAKHSTNYTQRTMTIAQGSFPDPRSNIDEIDIYEDEVGVQLFKFSGLEQLQRGSNGSTGSSFLQRISTIQRPAIRFSATGTFSPAISTEVTLVFAINATNPASKERDVAVTFDSSVTNAAEAAEKINTAYGATVAFSDGGQLVIFSPSYGPAASVTLRGGSNAIAVFGAANFLENDGTTGISGDIRIEGSGLAAQDDEDGDLTSPYIEYSRGIAKYSSAPYGNELTYTEVNAWPTDWAGFNTGSGDTNAFTGAQAAAVTFAGSNPTIPLKAATTTTPGDYLVVDGVRPSASEVILVEETRFKLGTINSSSSVYSASTGELVTRIYDALEVNIIQNAVPFSPRYAYFVAQNLAYGSITPEGEAATIAGSTDNVIAAQNAYAIGASAIDTSIQGSGTAAVTGLTLVVQETINGVQGADITITFAGTLTGTQIADAITANTDLACTALVTDDHFMVLKSSLAGAGNTISVKSNGSINDLLGFSTSAATSDSGRDFEIAAAATFTGQPIDPTDASTGGVIEIDVLDAEGITYELRGSITTPSAFADMDELVAAIVSAFNGTGNTLFHEGRPVATVEADGDALKFSSVEGGASAEISVFAANPALGLYSSDYKKSVLTFTDLENLTAFDLEISSSSILSPPVTGLPGSGGTTLSGVLTELLVGLNYADHHAYIDSDTNTIVVLHKGTGTGNINSTGVAPGTAAITVTNSDMPDIDEEGADRLKGSSLKFYLDDNPYLFEIASFDANSVPDAVDAINELVGGATDIASYSATTGAITLTSSMVGAASKLEIDSTGTAPAQGSTIMDFPKLEDSGAGRPNPDFYIDPLTNGIVLGPQQLRNVSTGIPYAINETNVGVYIEYKALRKDVTSAASDPGLLSFGSVTELEASIGPISTENPLALGAYLCMLNSPGITISCLGVDESTDAAPLGTVDSYLRALEFIESKEVYSIAPMTDDPYIQQLVSTHVQSLSQPSERGERIALLWKPTPTREVDTSIQGGSGEGTQTGINGQLRTESNHSSDIITAGISDLSSIDVDDDGLYVEVTLVALGATAVRNYSVSAVDGLTLTLRTSFSSGQNDDGFYSETALSGTASYSSISYVLRIRGDKLLITGTTLPDTTKITQTAASQASGFSNRRVFLLFGDSVDVSLDGVSTNVPGYYIAAGLAGMIGSQNPQQPFTNLVMTGYSRVYGTDDTYSENQMDVIADGGRYLLKNLGGGIAARHQRSTSNLTIESRELSITKAIDFLAKGLREINRVFIGKFVITPGFLDQLTMANEGYLRSVTQQGVVRTAALKSLLQSEAAPDTVLIEVEVQPAYPCNKIRITIVS